jgi:exopolysaccharide biosynthesis polyprenyl glycosylphosphotransferase
MKKSELFWRVIILPVDYLVIFFSFYLSYEFREWLGESFLIPRTEFLLLAFLLSFIWIVTYWLVGVYRLNIQRNSWEELFDIVFGSLASVTLASSLIFFIKEIDFSRIVLVSTTTTGILLLLVVRFVREMSMRFLYQRGIGVRKVLIIGDGDTTHIVLGGIAAERDPGIKVVDVITADMFEQKFKEYKPDEVIQTNPQLPNDQVTKIINICEERGCIFRFVPNLFEVPAANVATYNLAGVPIVTLSVTAIDGWFAVFKRVIDIVGATIALVLASPIFLITAIAIKLDSEGTVLYQQVRVGRNGEEFHLYKFRSMRMMTKNGHLVHADADIKVEQLKETQKNYKLEHDPRITKVGAFIRKTSIDELPQLFNVLKGELSLVGPRAYLKKELDSQLEKHPEAQGLVRRLTTVRPGITGIWQVSGRSNIDFSERVAMDAYYATHANLALDIKILLQTLPVVIRGTGAM